MFGCPDDYGKQGIGDFGNGWNYGEHLVRVEEKSVAAGGGRALCCRFRKWDCFHGLDDREKGVNGMSYVFVLVENSIHY